MPRRGENNIGGVPRKKIRDVSRSEDYGVAESGGLPRSSRLLEGGWRLGGSAHKEVSHGTGLGIFPGRNGAARRASLKKQYQAGEAANLEARRPTGLQWRAAGIRSRPGARCARDRLTGRRTSEAGVASAGGGAVTRRLRPLEFAVRPRARRGVYPATAR